MLEHKTISCNEVVDARNIFLAARSTDLSAVLAG
jgi:hypothetical protein